MDIGARIKDLRKQKGLTLEQVGDRVGVGKSTVRKWEEGTIQNMGQDKIANLAAALGTTPAYLMGYSGNEDEWTAHFRLKLTDILESSDRADIRSAGIDYDRLVSVCQGAFPLSLAEACSISDQIGCSLDDLVGLNDNQPTISENADNELTAEIIRLFARVPESRRQEALNYLRYLAQNEDNP